MPLTVERDTVSLADIKTPGASRASYLLARARKAGTLLKCESKAEREEARAEARMEGSVLATMAWLAEAPRGRQYAPMNRFLAARHGPPMQWVQCWRCENASRPFYDLTKPGEFTHIDGEWQCHACTHVLNVVRQNPRYLRRQCPVRPLGWSRLRPLPRWSRRLLTCRCVPTTAALQAAKAAAAAVTSPASP